MFGFGKRIRFQNHPDIDENNLRPHDVVGESYHQAELARARKHERKSGGYLWVALRPDPKNPHDPNAIRVEWVMPDGSGTLHVGHIPRTDTAGWHPIIASAPRGTVWCWPAETTGEDGQTIGLRFLD